MNSIKPEINYYKIDLRLLQGDGIIQLLGMEVSQGRICLKTM